MKVALDLDGTISTAPAKFNQLSKALMSAGHEVVILTAAAGELPPPLRPTEVTRRLAGLGMSYSKLVCLESCEKAAWCRDHRVDILVDDSLDIMVKARVLSPSTICLQVFG